MDYDRSYLEKFMIGLLGAFAVVAYLVTAHRAETEKQDHDPPPDAP